MKGGVKVTEIQGAYSIDGVSYGPFQASAERPFLEVPEALANGLGLPRYVEGGQPAPAPIPDAGGDTATLEARVKALSAELETTKADLHAATRDRDEAQRLVADLKGSRDLAKQQSDEQRERANGLQARVSELENQQEEYRQNTAAAVGEAERLREQVAALEGRPLPAVILPPDAVERLESVSGISKKLAAQGVEALLAPAVPPAEEPAP